MTCELTTCPVDDCCVSKSCAAPAFTVTVSATLPACSLTSAESRWFTFNTRPGREAVENPGADAVTV